MRTASSRRTRRTKNEINMVPFIDVMLVLLIIFMVTAPLITPGRVDLPSAGPTQRTPDVYIEVIVDKTEQLQVRMSADAQPPQSVAAPDLAPHVLRLAAGSAMPVLVSADKAVKYEAVMDVVRRLRSAGIERVALSTL